MDESPKVVFNALDRNAGPIDAVNRTASDCKPRNCYGCGRILDTAARADALTVLRELGG